MQHEVFRFQMDVRPTHELLGMSVEASDGRIGKVSDVVATSAAVFVLVDTGPWILGREIAVPAGLVAAVDRDGGSLRIDRPKEQLRHAPPVDFAGFDRDESAAVMLVEYYGPEPAQVPSGPEASSSAPVVPTPVGGGERGEAREPGSSQEADTAEFATGAQAGPLESAQTETVAAPEVADAEPRMAEPVAEIEGTESVPFGGPEPRGTESAASRPEQVDAAVDKADTRRRPTRKAKPRGEADVPIASYESLSVADLKSKLRGLAQSDLRKVERFERGHENRRTVIDRIEALRGDEPWRDYDRQNVGEITKRLANADEERARFVRDYERRHKDRNGVVEAARRRLAPK